MSLDTLALQPGKADLEQPVLDCPYCVYHYVEDADGGEESGADDGESSEAIVGEGHG